MSKAWRESKVLRRAEMRAENRRIAGFLMADGTIQFRFKRLMPDRSVFVSHIRLTPEATRAMAEIMIKLSSPNAPRQDRREATYSARDCSEGH